MTHLKSYALFMSGLMVMAFAIAVIVSIQTRTPWAMGGLIACLFLFAAGGIWTLMGGAIFYHTQLAKPMAMLCNGTATSSRNADDLSAIDIAALTVAIEAVQSLEDDGNLDEKVSAEKARLIIEVYRSTKAEMEGLKS